MEKRQVQTNAIEHFDKKLQEETRKIEVAEQAAELVQQEFTVRSSFSLGFLVYRPCVHRTGEKKHSSIASLSIIPAVSR